MVKRRFPVFAICTVILGGLSIASVADARQDRAAAFHEIANEIVDQIRAEESNPEFTYLSERQGRARVAIRPFDKEQLPVSQSTGDRFYDFLSAALHAHPRRSFDVMARSGLESVIDDEILREKGGNWISALLERSGEVDILIVGSMQRYGDQVDLSYKAIGMDGKQLAATVPRTLTIERYEQLEGENVVGFTQALNVAARSLADQASDMSELVKDGIRYEDTGIHTSFGRDILDRLPILLSSQLSNVITGRKLRVRAIKMARTRGLTDGSDLVNVAQAKRAGTYVLTGSWWVREEHDAVELRLFLRNTNREAATWTGFIHLADVRRLEIRPPGRFPKLRENDGLGPIGFHLTTDRGKDPSYQIGETMDLIVRTDREAWLYCFYRIADGTFIQIFPNPHFWTHAKVKAPRLEAERLTVIPGDDATLFPFELKFGPPAGVELVKCFAVDRDVTEELPEHLRGRDPYDDPNAALPPPLPPGEGEELSRIFADLDGAGVTEASVVLTITE